LIGYYWSGKHKKAFKGINLISLYYTNVKGVSVPVTYRTYNKSDGKTKNDYLKEMINEVISQGIKAKNITTTDSWYASKQNLDFFKEKEFNFGVALAKNRLFRVDKGNYISNNSLEIPKNGLIVELKSLGKVKVFKRVFKNGTTHYYALFFTDEDKL
jgi:hypothetical protein